VNTLRPHGTLCFVGAPPKTVSLPAFPLISVARSVCGSNTGSPGGILEMLDVAARHGVQAKIEKFRMSDANQALKRLRKSQVRYRAVLGN
jgi:uncharacterized zinc-type alcohol dehydrogenase-like protein